MKKRILVLSFYFPPDLCAGSFRTQSLIESLNRLPDAAQFEIDIITTLPNRYANFQTQALATENKGNTCIYRIALPSHKSGFVDQAKAFTRYFFKAQKIAKRKKYDAVYATSSRLFTAFLGAKIASKQKTPLFLDIRDIFTDTMQSILKFPVSLLLPLFKYIERYTIKTANHINLVSEGFLSYFQVKENCKISTISNGIDQCFHDMRYEKAKQPIKRIVYAGNIGKGQALEKIIPTLASATKELCEFYIIGGGGQQQNLINACKTLSNVYIFPPVVRDELIAHYQNADILFLHLDDLPAFNKVLPSKIFEYAITGKPILAGITGYAADFAQQQITGSWLFHPCDAENAIKQLHRILETQCASYNRDAFYEKFNREKLMRELAKQVIALSHTHNHSPAQ